MPTPWRNDGPVAMLLPWQGDQATRDALRSSFVGRIYSDENTSMPILACFISYFGLMFLVLRWWKTTEMNRSKRFSALSVAGVALWAYLLLFLLPSVEHRELAFTSMLLTAVVCQAAAPWKEKVAVRRKKMRLAMA
jgi:hypothetical protein